MHRQKSFIDTNATLYVVATPIGNLSEMTPRAIDILKTVDVIAAEDTRNTQKLLSHFDIHTKCIAHHLFNETPSADGIIEMLKNGKNIAIVSDAGYPLISDPGQFLVEKVVENGFSVVPISGANAMLNALVASGLCSMKFYFNGFLPSKDGHAKKELLKIKVLECTTIFYESPHRIERTLELMLEVLGDRKICLAREITKKFEEFIRGSISEVLADIENIKGEMVIVVEKSQVVSVVDFVSIVSEVKQLVDDNVKPSKAIKDTSVKYNISKNDLYKMYHDEVDAND